MHRQSYASRGVCFRRVCYKVIGPDTSNFNETTSAMSTDAPQSDDGSDRFNEVTGRPTRAAKACRRCHRKKLRCHGGHPCNSCKRAHQSCDFGETSIQAGGSASGGTETADVNKRFQNLENLVNTLLAKVSPTQDSRYATGVQNSSFTSRPMLPTPDQSSLLASGHPNGSGSMDPNDLTMNGPTGSAQFHFDPLPGVSITPATATIPMPPPESNHLVINARSPPTPSSSHSRDRHQGSAEGRLALLARVGSQYSAPLRPLAFQPAHWENADHTRPPSPSREDEPASQVFWQSMEVRPSLTDDPLSLGWVDQTISDELVTMWVMVFLMRSHVWSHC